MIHPIHGTEFCLEAVKLSHQIQRTFKHIQILFRLYCPIHYFHRAWNTGGIKYVQCPVCLESLNSKTGNCFARSKRPKIWSCQSSWFRCCFSYCRVQIHSLLHRNRFMMISEWRCWITHLKDITSASLLMDRQERANPILWWARMNLERKALYHRWVGVSYFLFSLIL